MPKRALILDLQNKCNLWLMRSATDPGPEILRLDLNTLEENIIETAVAVVKNFGADHLLPVDELICKVRDIFRSKMALEYPNSTSDNIRLIDDFSTALNQAITDLSKKAISGEGTKRIERQRAEEMITDATIDKIWGYANFGSMPKRDVIKDGLLKRATGYWTGNTSQNILRELGLIDSKLSLTQFGREYLYEICKPERS